MVVHIAPKIIRLVAVKEIREDGVRSWEASQPLLQDRIVDVCDPEIIIDVPCTASKNHLKGISYQKVFLLSRCRVPNSWQAALLTFPQYQPTVLNLEELFI